VKHDMDSYVSLSYINPLVIVQYHCFLLGEFMNGERAGFSGRAEVVRRCPSFESNRSLNYRRRVQIRPPEITVRRSLGS
jgi:hypothetical protein